MQRVIVVVSDLDFGRPKCFQTCNRRASKQFSGLLVKLKTPICAWTLVQVPILEWRKYFNFFWIKVEEQKNISNMQGMLQNDEPCNMQYAVNHPFWLWNCFSQEFFNDEKKTSGYTLNRRTDTAKLIRLYLIWPTDAIALNTSLKQKQVHLN